MATDTAHRCGICCDPASHRIESEGWDGYACPRHADHVEHSNQAATVTPLAA